MEAHFKKEHPKCYNNHRCQNSVRLCFHSAECRSDIEMCLEGPEFCDLKVKSKTFKSSRPKCPKGTYGVFHQYDNNGKGECGCEGLNDPCRSDKGPKGPQCIAKASCGP